MIPVRKLGCSDDPPLTRSPLAEHSARRSERQPKLVVRQQEVRGGGYARVQSHSSPRRALDDGRGRCLW